MMISIKDNSLFHYTSFCSAVKIIASQKLLFSECKSLNDIQEIHGPTVIGKKSDCDEIEDILADYCQISFTENKGRSGFDIPAMWGHYAERGRGVCLVFDRKAINDAVRREGLQAGSIQYSSLEDPYAVYYDKENHGSPEEYIRTNTNNLFFRKSIDWKYEQEFRIIKIGPASDPLSVSGAISGAILFFEKHDEFLNSSEYLALSKLLPPRSVYRYDISLGHGVLYNEEGESTEREIVYNAESILSIECND